MNYIILTGTSRGIGLATAKELLKNKTQLFAISRSKNTELIEYAQNHKGSIDYIEFDLNNTDKISSLMKNIFNKINKTADFLGLINNAGMLSPVKPIHKSTPENLEKNITVNVIAPMGLISQFIAQAIKYRIEKRIINISSGAAEHAYAGWSGYCTSKAGIDMLTRVVAREQESEEFPAKIMSFAPGVVATDMQNRIRNTNRKDFPKLDKFLKLKRDDKLLAPKTVGKKIQELLFQDEFPNGKKLDIRNL